MLSTSRRHDYLIIKLQTSRRFVSSSSLEFPVPVPGLAVEHNLGQVECAQLAAPPQHRGKEGQLLAQVVDLQVFQPGGVKTSIFVGKKQLQ